MDAASHAECGVGGVDPCRRFADTLTAEVWMQVAVEHRAGLADRGRRPQERGDRDHASSSSDTADDEPIAFTDDSSASRRSSPRSASARLPWTVALRYRGLRVSGSVPAYTRISHGAAPR